MVLEIHRLKNEPWPKLHTLYNNLKCIINLKVRHKTVKLLEDNIREDLWDLGLCEEFLDVTLKEIHTRKKTDEFDFIKMENFCSVKSSVQRLKRQATGWEKTFANRISDKGLISRIYKEFSKCNFKNNSNKKWSN